MVGAKVTLTEEGQSVSQEVTSSEDGQFTFTNVAPGSFQLVITSEGFAAHTSTGELHSGENFTVPQVSMVLATNATEVRVEVSAIESAQEQLKDEEKQRVLGIIPNFYVTYVPNAAPLTPKQKFNLAWRLNIDPVSFLLVGQTAGIQQAQNEFSEFGQGAQGYAKRYGAAYATFTVSNFLGSAVLPSVFKQDPRYFYKGAGTTKSRVLYALANAVICKSDGGHWQVNYSGIIGSLASGGYLQPVLPGKRSQWARIDIRKYRDEHWEYRSFQSDAGICVAEANAQSSEHLQHRESELTVNS